MTARRISDADLALRLSGALSREAMLPLLDLRDERALSAQLADALRGPGFAGYAGGCPWCGETSGHLPDCRRAAALAAYEARTKEGA